MLKRITIWSAVVVVMVLALQLARRDDPSPPESRSRQELPAVDPAPGPTLPLPEPASPSPVEEAARVTGDPRAASAASEAGPTEVPRKFERRFMFDCNGDRIFVRVGDGEASLLPPGSLTGY